MAAKHNAGKGRRKQIARRPGAKAKLAGPKTLEPVRLKGGKLPDSDDGGPLEWLLPIIESAYAPLHERDAAPPPGAARLARAVYHPKGTALATPAASIWRDRLQEFKRRKAAAMGRPRAAVAPLPGMAAVPGGLNWMPLGPSVVMNGQTVGNQPVGGRVARLAISPGANVIYAATANGGVFRSTDGATTWHSLMDRFDLDPTNFASASLICGAIAIDHADPNRIYVGTGEGDTAGMFSHRVTDALPAYRGVGMLRSDDGGLTWATEPSSPDLAGQACFAIAVDPANRENALVGTTQGLYRRVPQASGGFHWVSVASGTYASVAVAASAATKRFFAALWGVGSKNSAVSYSDDSGKTWKTAGTGFPAGTGRIALGARDDMPDLLYAFVANAQGAVLGLYRLDGMGSSWKKVGKLPNVLPVDNGESQGDYDIAIAVDPGDANLVFLGGSYANVDPYPASIWRCAIKPSGSAYTVASAKSIGTHAHADVHTLIHTPGDPTELWCGCDGGVFLNRAPRANGEFASQNNGLSCLCSNFIAQHPTDPNILFTGLQDNGTARTATGPIWSHVMGGDGGYCVINWARPDNVLAYANGVFYRSTTGGTSENGFATVWNIPWATMTQPLVSAPYNPARPADAELVAAGAGQKVFISTDFASHWQMQLAIPAAAGQVFALNFASPTRLFMGTTTGHVFRADRNGNAWTVVQLDNVAAGPMVMKGIINDIAVDWSDATLNSVFVAFAGMGDRRRVWRFDGTRWSVRSGPAGGNCLLDVEHNALAVDRQVANSVYVGADIGVWHSSDGGQSWNPLENGLPDAPVFDLQIHPTQRLLRAAIHGRGVYEIPIN